MKTVTVAFKSRDILLSCCRCQQAFERSSMLSLHCLVTSAPSTFCMDVRPSALLNRVTLHLRAAWNSLLAVNRT